MFPTVNHFIDTFSDMVVISSIISFIGFVLITLIPFLFLLVFLWALIYIIKYLKKNSNM